MICRQSECKVCPSPESSTGRFYYTADSMLICEGCLRFILKNGFAMPPILHRPYTDAERRRYR